MLLPLESESDSVDPVSFALTFDLEVESAKGFLFSPSAASSSRTAKGGVSERLSLLRPSLSAGTFEAKSGERRSGGRGPQSTVLNGLLIG